MEEGDRIIIDIPDRELRVDVPEEELERRQAQKGPAPWHPKSRDRKVSKALRAYAALTTSADRGGVRVVDGSVF